MFRDHGDWNPLTLKLSDQRRLRSPTAKKCDDLHVDALRSQRGTERDQLAPRAGKRRGVDHCNTALDGRRASCGHVVSQICPMGSGKFRDRAHADTGDGPVAPNAADRRRELGTGASALLGIPERDTRPARPLNATNPNIGQK